MANRSIAMTPTLYSYFETVGFREDPLLRELRAETAPMPRAGMQIGPEQGQFMALLVAAMGARRALEIGVFTGYSSLCVAGALPDDGKLVACDISEEFTAVARRYWKRAGLDHKIELLIGPALESLKGILASNGPGSFDFAFIDADKSNYASYYQTALELVRVGGLIAIDNVLWGGRVASDDSDRDTVALRELNAHLHADDRIQLSMLPIGDGLTLARRLR